MKLGELFRRLSFGELSNLSLSNDGDGTILESKRPKMIIHTNEALLRLYSRFVLLEREVIIEQVGHITQYPLLVQYAESNTGSNEKHKYIKDLEDPFTDDAIQIRTVVDFGGHAYKLNDTEDRFSMFTPMPHVLQTPFPRKGVALSVGYQARHAIIKEDDNDDTWVEIPAVLEGAVQNYIAGQVYSHMNGQENLLKSSEYKAEWEKICATIEEKDLVNQTFSTSNTKFDKRGFV